MDNKLTLFHGSSSVVRIPDLSMSRTDIDFGKGFYMSTDAVTACKWACRTVSAICNEYTLSTENLKIYKFDLDEEWLNYVVRNRAEQTEEYSKYDDYDVLIGAIADDRLFHIIELYEDDLISSENAIKIMNCMNYGLQYVLKNQTAIEKLEHISHIKLQGNEKAQYKKQYHKEQNEGSRRANQLLKELNGR